MGLELHTGWDSLVYRRQELFLQLRGLHSYVPTIFMLVTKNAVIDLDQYENLASREIHLFSVPSDLRASGFLLTLLMPTLYCTTSSGTKCAP